MNQNLIVSLASNATLLLSLGIIYEISYLIPRKLRKTGPHISGLIIGLVGVIIMTVPIQVSPGVIIDTRTILLSVTALIFGPIHASVAMLVTGLYRLWIGGAGTAVGIANILMSGLLGLLWRKVGFRTTHATQSSSTTHAIHISHASQIIRHAFGRWLSIYLMGVCVNLVKISLLALMPGGSGPDIVRMVGWPSLLLYPPATVLLSYILIHQQERNEALVRKSEDQTRYKSIFENEHVVMLLIDPSDNRIVDANPAAARFYGWSRDQLRQKRISDINTLPPELLKEEMDQSVGRYRKHFLFQHRIADGSIRDVEVFSGPIQIDGKPLLFSLVHDITERIVAQDELTNSEQRFRAVVEGAPEAIFIQNGGKFVYANRATVSLFGAENAGQLIGTPVFDRFHPDFHERIRQRIDQLKKGLSVPVIEQPFIRLDGSIVYVDVTAVLITFNKAESVLVFCRDATERKHIEVEKRTVEARLRQQQKLEAIGLLAGGVAHEINNPITGIMNYAQLVLDDIDPESTDAEYLRGIISESRRVSEIVRNLLQFSRQDRQAHSLACARDIIDKTVLIIRTILKKDQIDLQIEIEPGLPGIPCRSEQIQQVLMNLLTNARDALNEKYPAFHEDKLIRLTAQHHQRDNQDWVCIGVEDHGSGISEAVRQKMFEPFFSTKPKEKGTGLGLSISFGIVQDHGGFFEIDTQPGHYTTIRLFLPIARPVRPSIIV